LNCPFPVLCPPTRQLHHGDSNCRHGRAPGRARVLRLDRRGLGLAGLAPACILARPSPGERQPNNRPDPSASEPALVRPAVVLKTDLFDETFGDGLAELFERRGNRVIGRDLAFSTARGALQKRNCAANVVTDVRHLPFNSGRFDCVLYDSTLDHFGNQKQIQPSLEELSRVFASKEDEERCCLRLRLPR